MNRGTIAGGVLALFLCVGSAFALPTSYDFCVRESDDIVVKSLVLGDTLSFDYWFSYSGEMKPNYCGRLSLFCDDPAFEYEGKLYGDGYTTIGEISSRCESNDWRTAWFDVPFWSLYDQEWNRRTDPHPMDFSIQLWGGWTPEHPRDDYPDMCTMYIRNLRSYDRDDISPVPEPSSIALLGSGLIGFVGFGFKRRKSVI